jgi:hypothetical protein
MAYMYTFSSYQVTSVLCEVNKEVKENNNNNKNQIQSWSFIYKHGEHRQQSKEKKNTQNYEPNEFHRMRVKKFLSESVATHPQYWSRVVRFSLGSILLGVSREDDENIVSHRVSIKF